MNSDPRSSLTLNTRGVSPVIGSILMLVMVVLLVSLGGGAILSQYDTPQGEPDADLKFDQTVENTTYETSNVYIETVNMYSADSVKILHDDSSVDLYDESTGAYIGYEDAGTGAIITPDDPAFDANEVPLTGTGDRIVIYNASEQFQFTMYAENKRGQVIVTKYTVRYIGP